MPGSHPHPDSGRPVLRCDSVPRWLARFAVILAAALLALVLLSWPDATAARSAGAKALLLDFGDAPAPYPTTFADDGARHGIVPGGPYFWDLGLVDGVPDFEADGLPSADALGDDGNGDDDEEPEQFVILPSPFLIGQAVRFMGFAYNTATRDTYVNLWVDWNQDGDWNDDGEQTFDDLAIDDFLPGPARGERLIGSYDELIQVPDDAIPGTTFVRARISTQPGLGVTGEAFDGEVEDFTIEVIEDFVFADGFEEPVRVSYPLR